jgi:hypothetical protein
MYVRWVVRRHKTITANTSFHDAYLVESYRDESGSPRQRTICYLGNIRSIDGEFPPIERELFFLRAERILWGMGNISTDDREETMEMLREKVCPLTANEVLAAFTENLRWYRQWWAQNGGGPSDEEIDEIVRASKGTPGPM